MTALRDVTLAEWAAYEWHEVSIIGDACSTFVRGKRRTSPPNDGFAYVRCDTFADAEYKWERVKTAAPIDTPGA